MRLIQYIVKLLKKFHRYLKIALQIEILFLQTLLLSPKIYYPPRVSRQTLVNNHHTNNDSAEPEYTSNVCFPRN